MRFYHLNGCKIRGMKLTRRSLFKVLAAAPVAVAAAPSIVKASVPVPTPIASIPSASFHSAPAFGDQVGTAKYPFRGVGLARAYGTAY